MAFFIYCDMKTITTMATLLTVGSVTTANITGDDVQQAGSIIIGIVTAIIS